MCFDFFFCLWQNRRGRQGGRDGGRQGGREAGMEGGRDGGRQGGRDGGRQGGRDGGRQGEIERIFFDNQKVTEGREERERERECV